jgi:hypothetical protein
MRFLFLGGTGRSGTSAMAERLRVSPDVSSFLDVELRFLSEVDGLPDLYWSLVDAYSPQRADFALARFRIMFRALLDDAPGAVGLARYVSPAEWGDILDRFLSEFLQAGVPLRQTSESFFSAAASLLLRIGALAMPQDQRAADTYFLEKTPHNILRLRLLSRLPVSATYLHVVRDPRIVAASVARMPWGPGSIEASAIWVNQYFEEYFRVAEWAVRARIKLHTVNIEAIPADPRRAACQIYEALHIAGDETIFDDIALDTLNGAVGMISEFDVSSLNASLGPLASRLGYHRDNFGEFTNVSGGLDLI